MTLPFKAEVIPVIWYEDFEKWFKEVSGKEIDILTDRVESGAMHWNYTEFTISEYNPEDQSGWWTQELDSYMNNPTDKTFYAEAIEFYIEKYNLLPVGKYVILADW